MSRYGVRFCLWAGVVFALGGCHYSEEDSWKICCLMKMVGDEASSSTGRKIIIGWQKDIFTPDGEPFDAIDWTRPPHYSPKKNRIASSIADRLAGNPGVEASDYLRGLGMACESRIAVQERDLTRCRIELPVWVRCYSMNIFFPGGAPVPKELREPIPALLTVSIDVSRSAFLDNVAQIKPVPGGRLCHR